jgi:phage repressor protein C with HTH and peptisase S24 domain
MIPGMVERPRKKDAQLTEENLRESARLKALYESANHGLSQAAFGAMYDIGNQGAVWQCLNGKGMPISLKAAMGFARGLGVDISEFSPRLAAEASKHAEFAASASEEEFVAVKRVSVTVAAGSGSEPPHIDEVIGQLQFSRSFLRNIGVSPASARVVDVRGVSMEPDIKDGSVLLINTSNREPVNGGIFALVRPAEGLIVKKLVKLPKGGWVARSENRDFEDIPISHGEPISIIGRAHWMGAKL